MFFMVLLLVAAGMASDRQGYCTAEDDPSQMASTSALGLTCDLRLFECFDH